MFSSASSPNCRPTVLEQQWVIERLQRRIAELEAQAKLIDANRTGKYS